MLKIERRPRLLRHEIDWSWPWPKVAHALGSLDLSDVMILIGLVGIGVGLWQVAPWLAWLVVSTLVLLLGLVVAVLRVRADVIAAAVAKRPQG